MDPTKTQKSRGYFSFREDGTISIINAITKEEHAPRRRLLSRAFSMNALQKYEPLVFKTAKAFCDSLLGNSDSSAKHAHWGPSLDMGILSKYKV
jgi:cytochrome P450